MLTKAQAERKFAAFKNHALMMACGSASNEAMKAECLAKFTTAQLIEFWNETKNLTYAEYYGQTPWEIASVIAADAAVNQRVERIHAAAAYSARHGKRAKVVQLDMFEAQQLTLI